MPFDGREPEPPEDDPEKVARRMLGDSTFRAGLLAAFVRLADALPGVSPDEVFRRAHYDQTFLATVVSLQARWLARHRGAP